MLLWELDVRITYVAFKPPKQLTPNGHTRKMRSSALYRFYWSPTFFIVMGWAWLGVVALCVWLAPGGWKLTGMLFWVVAMTTFEGHTERVLQVHRAVRDGLRRRKWLRDHPGFE